MAMSKMSIKGIKNQAAEYAKLVFAELPSLEVKNASPTRAGNMIQVRVIWKDSTGKKQLGYYSDSVSSILRGGKPSIEYFLLEVMRLSQRARRSKVSGWEPDLARLGAYDDPHVLEVLKESMDKMNSVAHKAGARKNAHNLEKAREIIRANVTWATTQGLEESEILKIVRSAYKLAVVAKVQDS